MVNYDFAKTPIVDIVNQIFLYAARNRASDIHLDPREESLMVRLRVDGNLINHSNVPKAYEKNLITRVKLVSGMNITETRLPQDGAIKGRIAERDLDMRVSALPTNEGEKIVIRILDFQKSLAGIESLGFTKDNEEKVKKMMSEPNGIILVTGATGSGKSTTTYSMLQALNKEETNIITVEDPIEMNIEGVNQVQVNSEIGMTFASALRSILRQDPNIILIGEIRDSETAQIAIRAAITGHLVLSTIHTNNGLATIERLLDMNVQRYLLSTALTGIVSQKLARTLCPHCKKLRKVTKYEKHLFKTVLNKNVTDVYEPVGCDQCHEGFQGRIALHEVILLSEKLKAMLADENTEKEDLRDAIYDGDTKTLLQDALEKVIAGYTTFQEIYRVVDIDVDLDKSIKKSMGIKVEDDIKNHNYTANLKRQDLANSSPVVYYVNSNKIPMDDDFDELDKLISEKEDEGLEDGLDIFENNIDLTAIKPNNNLLDNDLSSLSDLATDVDTTNISLEPIKQENNLNLNQDNNKILEIIDVFSDKDDSYLKIHPLIQRKKLEIIDSLNNKII